MGDFTRWESESSFDSSLTHLIKSIREETPFDGSKEKDWFLEQEEYSPQELKKLKEFLSQAIKDPHQIKQILYYCGLPEQFLHLHVSPDSLWFAILQYAHSLTEKDWIAHLVAQACELDSGPKNKYLEQAEDLIEEHYSED